MSSFGSTSLFLSFVSELFSQHLGRAYHLQHCYKYITSTFERSSMTLCILCNFWRISHSEGELGLSSSKLTKSNINVIHRILCNIFLMALCKDQTEMYSTKILTSALAIFDASGEFIIVLWFNEKNKLKRTIHSRNLFHSGSYHIIQVHLVLKNYSKWSVYLIFTNLSYELPLL